MFRQMLVPLVLVIAAGCPVIGADLPIAPPETITDQAAILETGSGCTTPGTITFPDLPDVRAEIVPSVQRELASVGRMAKTNGCTVEVTCVSADGADSDARATRNRQCRSAAQSIVRFEQRSSIRSGLLEGVLQMRADAGAELIAGTVYVTLR
jgi:hypothetical protein